MATLPRAIFWRRTDLPGSDVAFLDDRQGLAARGVASASGPVPHVCRYELRTDPDWATVRLELVTEGAGWQRTARLERAAGRWRVTTTERGDLDAAMRAAGRAPVGLPGTEEPTRLAEALDVDLYAAPLFNTLPIRRLGLLGAEPGRSRDITVAFVRVPSLEVLPGEQTYTVVDARTVRYAAGSFTADLTVDGDGYVIHYPGLADGRPA